MERKKIHHEKQKLRNPTKMDTTMPQKLDTDKKIIGQADPGGIVPESSRIAYENRWLKIREDIIRYPNGLKGMFGALLSQIIIFCINRKNQAGFCHYFS